MLDSSNQVSFVALVKGAPVIPNPAPGDFLVAGEDGFLILGEDGFIIEGEGS